ncbi:transporter substrate-binding domain-containing protein [Maridesulfovibrio sp.]|uniref:substrate-binding periplasmic protein n=1 Tax=Maridesulfovibrio sp. TaxID=2795000 RepID=UPI0029C9D2B6|nr:transporter substrate-binding domain-containing protein [Maridesulfovibrio sp.]
MRQFFISVVFLFLFFPSILHAEKLVFVTLDTPPQTFLKDGKPTGFLVDIVSEAARRAGYSPVVRIVPWKRAMVLVEKGQVDAVFNAGYNEERNKFLRYPDTVLITEKVVALRHCGSGVYFSPDFSDAKKYIGGVGRAFYYGEKVDKAINEHRFKRIEEVPNINLNTKKLLLDRIDFFFADYYPALHFLNKNNLFGKLEVITNSDTGRPVFFSQSDTYLAFSRKKNPVAFRKVSAELKKMKLDGTYLKIASRYLPVLDFF